MKTGKVPLTIVVSLLMVAGLVASSTARQDEILEGPPFLEGAWYGMTTIPGLGEYGSLDTFVTNVRPGSGGSVHCTMAPSAGRFRHPEHRTDPTFWLIATASAHGNWVRIGTGRYAVTLVRALTDQDGIPYGWIRHWAVFTPGSEDAFTGTMNVQLFRRDGAPVSPVFSGTLERTRVGIIMPEE